MEFIDKLGQSKGAKNTYYESNEKLGRGGKFLLFFIFIMVLIGLLIFFFVVFPEYYNRPS